MNAALYIITAKVTLTNKAKFNMFRMPLFSINVMSS